MLSIENNLRVEIQPFSKLYTVYEDESIDCRPGNRNYIFLAKAADGTGPIYVVKQTRGMPLSNAACKMLREAAVMSALTSKTSVPHPHVLSFKSLVVNPENEDDDSYEECSFESDNLNKMASIVEEVEEGTGGGRDHILSSGSASGGGSGATLHNDPTPSVTSNSSSDDATFLLPNDATLPRTDSYGSITTRTITATPNDKPTHQQQRRRRTWCLASDIIRANKPNTYYLIMQFARGGDLMRWTLYALVEWQAATGRNLHSSGGGGGGGGLSSQPTWGGGGGNTFTSSAGANSFSNNWSGINAFIPHVYIHYPEARIKAIAAQILSALEYSHGLAPNGEPAVLPGVTTTNPDGTTTTTTTPNIGIVHRDIKPDNFFVRDSFASDRVDLREMEEQKHKGRFYIYVRPPFSERRVNPYDDVFYDKFDGLAENSSPATPSSTDVQDPTSTAGTISADSVPSLSSSSLSSSPVALPPVHIPGAGITTTTSAAATGAASAAAAGTLTAQQLQEAAIPHLLLADFDRSKAAEDGKTANTTILSYALAAGKADFLPPEWHKATGERKTKDLVLGASADVWALGLSLLALHFTGLKAVCHGVTRSIDLGDEFFQLVTAIRTALAPSSVVVSRSAAATRVNNSIEPDRNSIPVIQEETKAFASATDPTSPISPLCGCTCGCQSCSGAVDGPQRQLEDVIAEYVWKHNLPQPSREFVEFIRFLLSCDSTGRSTGNAAKALRHEYIASDAETFINAFSTAYPSTSLTASRTGTNASSPTGSNGVGDASGTANPAAVTAANATMIPVGIPFDMGVMEIGSGRTNSKVANIMSSNKKSYPTLRFEDLYTMSGTTIGKGFCVVLLGKRSELPVIDTVRDSVEQQRKKRACMEHKLAPGTAVAVKWYRIDSMLEQDVRHLLKKDLDARSKARDGMPLRHTNIATIHDVFEHKYKVKTATSSSSSSSLTSSSPFPSIVPGGRTATGGNTTAATTTNNNTTTVAELKLKQQQEEQKRHYILGFPSLLVVMSSAPGGTLDIWFLDRGRNVAFHDDTLEPESRHYIRKTVNRKKKMSIIRAGSRLAATIVAQVLRAVRYMHQQGKSQTDIRLYALLLGNSRTELSTLPLDCVAEIPERKEYQDDDRTMGTLLPLRVSLELPESTRKAAIAAKARMAANSSMSTTTSSSTPPVLTPIVPAVHLGVPAAASSFIPYLMLSPANVTLTDDAYFYRPSYNEIPEQHRNVLDLWAVGDLLKNLLTGYRVRTPNATSSERESSMRGAAAGESDLLKKPSYTETTLVNKLLLYDPLEHHDDSTQFITNLLEDPWFVENDCSAVLYEGNWDAMTGGGGERTSTGTSQTISSSISFSSLKSSASIVGNNAVTATPSHPHPSAATALRVSVTASSSSSSQHRDSLMLSASDILTSDDGYSSPRG